MSNLLTPPGLLCAKTNKFVQMGIDPTIKPMPYQPGLWIKAKCSSCCLQPDEVSRGLGIPKEADVDLYLYLYLYLGLLEHSTCVFIWEALVESWKNRRPKPSNKGPSQDTDCANRMTSMTGDPERPMPEPFQWRPADLCPGREWHKERLVNLKAAAATCPDLVQAYEDRLEALKIHRKNYNEEGPAPKQLQLLWWEFLKEHWTPLCEGSQAAG
jgi:hypothetical protein